MSNFVSILSFGYEVENSSSPKIRDEFSDEDLLDGWD